MNEIIPVLTAAAEKAFRQLFQEHPDEHFYYCTLVMLDVSAPCISAWSEEALEVFLSQNGIQNPEDRLDYRYSYADSPYFAFGYEEYFSEAETLFSECFARQDSMSDSEYDAEVLRWLDAMEMAVHILDSSGLFGSRKERKHIFLNAEIMPPEEDNTLRAKRLNEADSPALLAWLKDAAE